MMHCKFTSTVCCLALLVIVGLVAPAASFAAVHCVRAGATGNGSGSDWTNAYPTLPATLTRGDTYYVAAGNYGPHNFSDPDSGTSVITVIAATAANDGTATGWNSAYQGQAVFSCASSCGSIIQFNTDYYVFSGVYRSTATGNPESDWVLESGYGFKVNNSNALAGATVAGGSGYKAGTCSSLSACNAAGIFVHDITVSYVDVDGAHPTTDSGDIDEGADFEGGSYNLDFSHLYVHDDAVPFYLRGSHGNQAGGGYYFGSGNGNTIEYTYIQHNYSSPTYHSEGCSCSEGLTNFTFRYNYSDQIGGVGGNGSTTHIGTASGADYNNGNGPNGPWFIYGNVFTCTAVTSTMNCAVGDGILAVWDAKFTGNIYFLNNTAYNLGSPFTTNPESGFGLGLAYTTPMQAVYSENNLFYQNDPMTIIPTGTTSWNGATMTSTTWSYNAYFKTPAAGGSDADANKQVSSANPFSGGTCCSLASDTTAGTNTSSLVAGNGTDMLGTTRGANGTWDRGAFQVSGTPPTVTVNTPTGVTTAIH